MDCYLFTSVVATGTATAAQQDSIPSTYYSTSRRVQVNLFHQRCKRTTGGGGKKGYSVSPPKTQRIDRVLRLPWMALENGRGRSRAIATHVQTVFVSVKVLYIYTSVNNVFDSSKTASFIHIWIHFSIIKSCSDEFGMSDLQNCSSLCALVRSSQNSAPRVQFYVCTFRPCHLTCMYPRHFSRQHCDSVLLADLPLQDGSQ